jgi:hypothetical protein
MSTWNGLMSLAVSTVLLMTPSLGVVTGMRLGSRWSKAQALVSVSASASPAIRRRRVAWSSFGTSTWKERISVVLSMLVVSTSA